MAKKILIVTDDAGESLEIYYAKHRFAEAGYVPVIAASRKKRLHGVIHDFAPDWNTYIEKPGYLIDADLAFDRVKVKDYAAVMLIGGRAPEFLRHHAPLLKIIQEFHRQEKWIFSICHGIQILIAAGLARGRKLTCYENVRLELEHVGSTWVNQPSVVDGKLITSQTWESHPEFYRDIFANLNRDHAVGKGSATVPVAPVGVSPTGSRRTDGPQRGGPIQRREVFGETPKTAGETPRAPGRTASFRLK